jgi:hypothetical protein
MEREELKCLLLKGMECSRSRYRANILRLETMLKDINLILGQATDGLARLKFFLFYEKVISKPKPKIPTFSLQCDIVLVIRDREIALANIPNLSVVKAASFTKLEQVIEDKLAHDNFVLEMLAFEKSDCYGHRYTSDAEKFQKLNIEIMQRHINEPRRGNSWRGGPKPDDDEPVGI